MSATLIHKMRCGCEFWVGLNYSGEQYPEMQYCEKHEISSVIASLRSDLEAAQKQMEILRSVLVWYRTRENKAMLEDDTIDLHEFSRRVSDALNKTLSANPSDANDKEQPSATAQPKDTIR